MAMREVDIEHSVDGAVIRWIITDKKLKANTSGIVVMVDMSLPEEYMEAVFAIARQLDPLLTMAAEKLRNDVMNIAKKGKPL